MRACKEMTRTVTLPLMLILLSIAASSQTAVADGATNPPNIILFVADDMGWANIGYHNSEHVITPTFDSYAKNGLTLDRHYVFWYCSPTRSSLMTGRLPMHVSEDNGNAGTVMGAVPTNMTMIPAKLKKAGYATYQVGKWHLGNIRRALVPAARGFDASRGYLGGAEDHYSHTNGGCGCNGKDMWDTNTPFESVDGIYGAYIYNNYSQHIIQTHNQSQPLFMYIALQNLHAPQQVPDEYSNKFPKSNYTDDYRIEQGMGNCADEVFKNVTDALKHNGLWDNTLLVFTSDNGGPASRKVSGSSANNYPLRGGKRTAWEGGVRVNAFVTGGFLPQNMSGKTLDGYIHACDWYVTFAKLAGVDPHDDVPGFPGVDGIDMWPYLTGQVKESPRTEIPLISGSRGALIRDQYKIVRGSQDYAFWQGPVYPNKTTDHKNEPSFDCGQGCLFDIINDPTEHNDLAKTKPDIFQQMLQRAQELDKTAFNPNRGGTGDKTECCQYTHSHNNYSGPYMP